MGDIRCGIPCDSDRVGERWQRDFRGRNRQSDPCEFTLRNLGRSFRSNLQGVFGADKEPWLLRTALRPSSQKNYIHALSAQRHNHFTAPEPLRIILTFPITGLITQDLGRAAICCRKYYLGGRFRRRSNGATIVADAQWCLGEQRVPLDQGKLEQGWQTNHKRQRGPYLRCLGRGVEPDPVQVARSQRDVYGSGITSHRTDR